MTRALLTVLVLLVLLALLGLMWWGWRARGKRQALWLEQLPAVPAELERLDVQLGPEPGMYLATVTAGNWQDRIVAGGLGVRAAARWWLTEQGVAIHRQGAETIWLPREAIIAARTDRMIAGKVLGDGGLLVVSWRLGEVALETGLRADDRRSYPRWVQQLEQPDNGTDGKERSAV